MTCIWKSLFRLHYLCTSATNEDISVASELNALPGFVVADRVVKFLQCPLHVMWSVSQNLCRGIQYQIIMTKPQQILGNSSTLIRPIEIVFLVSQQPASLPRIRLKSIVAAPITALQQWRRIVANATRFAILKCWPGTKLHMHMVKVQSSMDSRQTTISTT